VFVLFSRRSTNRVVAVAFAFCCSVSLSAQQHGASIDGPPSRQEIEQLKQLVHQLQARVAQLESQSKTQKTTDAQTSAPASSSNSGAAAAAANQDHDGSPSVQQAATATAITPDDRAVLDFLHQTTLNVALDGYYGYNFNRPVGRVNLLRAYDVLSNSFSLNQANLILEHAPDIAAGRRLGARLDLQFGQATETLQGSAVNELRPQVYRPLFQAYGTYVAPLGRGLTVDFGKWSSAMGIENNYNKDQINYSRSYFFNFLPFYHMGVRATYQFNNVFSLTYSVVNGAQQAEDFNGSKSQMVFLTIHPRKTVSWNINYMGGQEQRDVGPVLNPGFPAGRTQPGLPLMPVVPGPNGRQHIFDSYVTWNTTPKLILAAEADYVINRVFSESAPAHVDGGAAYARYQLTSKNAIAGRAEYLSDRGGLFSGTTQALKETTFTYEYKVADGFLMRTEWRRDFSNRPFFRGDTPGILKCDQNTATVGLVWWWGRKQGSWRSWIQEEARMQDVVFVIVTIAFFVLSLGYVRFCERVK